MSFNNNNPNAMGKIMGSLNQLYTEMGETDQSRHGSGEEERLYRQNTRMPSKITLSSSTTCTSLATSCGSQDTLAPNYSVIREDVITETSSEDEDDFEKTRRHFQQLLQISLGNEFKYRIEMEIQSAKGENLKNFVPYVSQLSTDNNKMKTDYSINNKRSSPTSPQKAKVKIIILLTQVFAAFAVSMGSLSVGFSFGYTSPSLPSMNDTLATTTEEKSWVGGLMPLAALVGGTIGGPLIEFFGRRRTISAIAAPFFLGWMLIANASNVIMVLAGRAFCGICVGIGSLAFPIYLVEVVQPEVRGALGLLPTVFCNIGILLAFLAGAHLNRYQLAFLGAALPVPFFILMLGTPETPRWYITRGCVNDARKSLQWLRGKNSNIDREFDDLTGTQAESDFAGGSGIGQLFNVQYTRAILIVLGLMLFQQLSGINAVVFYASRIFAMAGSNIDINLSIILGIVNFVSTFIATGLIDLVGRKILLYVSSVTMVITLVALGSYFYVRDARVDVSSLGWLPLVSLVLYMLGFSIGFGPIPWLMMGEILPAKIRGNAAALAIGFNWTCTLMVTKTFQNISDAIGMHGTIWLFSVFCLLGLFFVIFFVLETRGLSLEVIEKKVTGAPRRIRNIEQSHTGHTILLGTALVTALDNFKNTHYVRVLIDSASQYNIITTDCCKKLGLKIFHSCYSVNGIGDAKQTVKGQADVSLFSRKSSDNIRIKPIVINKITDRLPIAPVDESPLLHLHNLPLADSNFHIPAPIDMILGADVFCDILKDGRVKGSSDQPQALETIFGYIVIGPVLFTKKDN